MLTGDDKAWCLVMCVMWPGRVIAPFPASRCFDSDRAYFLNTVESLVYTLEKRALKLGLWRRCSCIGLEIA